MLHHGHHRRHVDGRDFGKWPWLDCLLCAKAGRRSRHLASSFQRPRSLATTPGCLGRSSRRGYRRCSRGRSGHGCFPRPLVAALRGSRTGRIAGRHRGAAWRLELFLRGSGTSAATVAIRAIVGTLRRCPEALPALVAGPVGNQALQDGLCKLEKLHLRLLLLFLAHGQDGGQDVCPSRVGEGRWRVRRMGRLPAPVESTRLRARCTIDISNGTVRSRAGELRAGLEGS